LDAINAIRGRDSDPEMTPLAALERPAASTRAADETGGLDLSIEMETGTGKTYTYLRTIFELAQARELGAFIIVVPSVAIREGVKTTIAQTRSHFASLYGGWRLADFVYTGEAAQVRSFGTTKGAIDVMIVTLDSFNKDQNLLRRATEAGGGAALIEQIASVSPVVILDEPQKMGSEKSQAAIDLLRPILTLRYSATHTEPLNVLYRLTPAEARRRRLVKAVEVCAIEENGVTSRPHVRVLKVAPGKKDWSAALEIERMDAGVLRPVKVSVRSSAREAAKLDLFELSDGRGAYADGWIIERIDATGVRFRNGTLIAPGKTCGPDRESLFRAQIRTTITEHIAKKAMADRHGAKVLSLFFIDKVANYAAKDGLIRRLFAEEFGIARGLADFPAEWGGSRRRTSAKATSRRRRRRRTRARLARRRSTRPAARATRQSAPPTTWIMKGKEDLLTFPSEPGRCGDPAPAALSPSSSRTAARRGLEADHGAVPDPDPGRGLCPRPRHRQGRRQGRRAPLSRPRGQGHDRHWNRRRLARSRAEDPLRPASLPGHPGRRRLQRRHRPSPGVNPLAPGHGAVCVWATALRTTPILRGTGTPGPRGRGAPLCGKQAATRSRGRRGASPIDKPTRYLDSLLEGPR
ncbi:MAG: DEAD/DEAH box helicase family protein, partial [Amaricoccus sp.]